ncbi:MAG: hypothetical protein RBT75_20645 [Anaerolineae bacterium]|jgi:hypothetical protein|nr:hypothetical protein [Anaerolineae bacterium]
MIHVTLRLTWQRRASPLLLALLLVILFSNLIAPETPVGAQMGIAAFIPSGGGRHFYLTESVYSTNQVRTACASGYHTASLWELYDVSNLIYDYNHPAAYTKADSGYGPPAYWYGWVRTGYDSSNSSTTGTGNCNNWSSTSNTVYGVSVRLSRTWETAPGDIGPWDATSFTCDYTGPVWCVGNFFTVYLPLVLRNF